MPEKLEVNLRTIFKCTPSLVTRLVEEIMAITGDPAFVAISIAFQVAAAGGLEAHAATMSADSIWMQDIYPLLKRSLS